MPNIIEQQDLLKGLPDTRLAMLLQNPVGDIPAFLVAAEAQRRQAIRQQFAAEGSKESVVDSLTKQLVPQNLKTQMQPPPVVPPTPEMQGVAALQQQQAMAQAAQNAQPQQMRHGGAVRRYQVGGYVDPFGIPDVPVTEDYDFSFPDFGLPPLIPEWRNPGEEEKEEKEKRGVGREMTPRELGDYYAMNRLDTEKELRKMAPPPIDAPPPPGDDLANEQPQDGETEDEFRARIEALYGSNGPSDWEKAQRWFAMAEQFLDPSKTTMQSIAGAGRAFADQSAAMSAAERQAARERERALLEYDISQSQADRSAKANALDLQRETYKFYAEQARAQVSAAQDQLKEIARQRNDYLTMNPGADPMNDKNLAEMDRQAKDLMSIIDQARGKQAGALKSLGALTGTDPSVTVFTGTGLATVGG